MVIGYSQLSTLAIAFFHSHTKFRPSGHRVVVLAQRKIEQFCAAIESEGRRQAAGVFVRPEEIPMPHDELLQEMNWVGMTELGERLGAWRDGDPRFLPRVKITRTAGTAPGDRGPGDDAPRDTAPARDHATPSPPAVVTSDSGGD